MWHLSQEMNGTTNEAEVRHTAQLFGDLVRVVSAKQLGPMLRTQVRRSVMSSRQSQAAGFQHCSRVA